jgi:hypothetical protein
MKMAFQVTNSFSAEVELPEEERRCIAQQAIEMAVMMDQGEDRLVLSSPTLCP